MVRAGPARRVPFSRVDERTFRRPPSSAVRHAAHESPRAPAPDIHAALAQLERPRKHYQWYYSTPPANADMWHCKQGVHDFLRAYYHHKSADWRQNLPFKLSGWIAEELAKMPTYYIMDLHEDMPATVAHVMPTPAEIAACRWLPDNELRVYSSEYQRTGFQGGLNWYRRGTGGTRHRRVAVVLRTQHRCARDVSSPAAATGVFTRIPARSIACSKPPVPAFAAVT